MWLQVLITYLLIALPFQLYPQELTKEQIETFVFQISSCDKKLTGFKLVDKPGIYTSLHGVIGCGSIVAQNSIGKTFTNLTISHIDIDRDIAILTSPQIEHLSGGLSYDRAKIKGGVSIKVWPFSYGVELIMDNNSNVRQVNPIVKLRSIASADKDFYEKLTKRKSPSLHINVINMSGGLKPGASGAPITLNGKVIGIGSGEVLNNRQSDFCFGVPLHDINPLAVNSELIEEMSRISSLPKNYSFLYESRAEIEYRRTALQGSFGDQKFDSKRNLQITFGPSIRLSISLKEGQIIEPLKNIGFDLPLKLRLKDGRILVSCIFRNLENKPIAEIIDNEWVINPNNYFQRNYDEKGLEVTDEDGLIRFQIEFLTPNHIEIKGIFVCRTGTICWVLPPDPNGGIVNGLVFNNDGGFVQHGLGSLTKTQIQNIGKKIPYLFNYPSDLHLGERVPKN